MAQKLVNQRWIYRHRPEKQVGPEHYEFVSEDIDGRLSDGELLIKNHYFSVDPYMRIQQAASNSWEAPHPLNTLQQGAVVGRVEQSRHSDFAIGDWVSAYTGWETWSKVHGLAAVKLDVDAAPVTTALGVLGMPGRTAWFGLMEAGKPQPGDIVAVSGASGAVGSLVAQYAKKAGCRVIAFAGGTEKCRWLKDRLGVDLAVDYRQFSDYKALQDYLDSEGIKVDVYFDNVGGMITDAIIPLINRRARIVICGQMSQYNGQLDKVEMGPRFLQHMLYQRATIQGILARDYNHRMDEMIKKVSPWINSGELVFEETIVEGFELLPEYLGSLFDRSSTGKLIVKA